ncbi:Protein OS-9 [Diaporthe australafricana]|uniref:Endoplasmic reticulum lectin n=1 Tax=Diaporthe australafricana TaxID=127596 RepID=A0ABR3WFL8_9PEZI
MLAYPQFEVVFPDTIILEKDAQRIIESSRSAQTTYTADFSSQTDLTSQIRESAPADAGQDGDPEDGMPEVSEEFEIINIPPSRFLCSVPVLAPPPAPNQTATDLAKAEEARELARANTRGWELMSDLENQCLYFVSGWWSYKFCYGQDIVQFHALPTNMKGGLPARDPHSQEYVLGRVQQPHSIKKSKKQNKELQTDTNSQETEFKPPPHTELQVKGDQRYLVQRMGGGTLCDLTERDRTIEIQYHCNPGSTGDRIGWIKEITTCSYLMLVHTPRLCEDVAFLPPKETRAHPISCQRIFDSEEEANAWRLRNSIEAAEAAGTLQGQEEVEDDGKAADATQKPQEAQSNNRFSGMEIGGIVIGSKQLHGTDDSQPPPKLKPPRGFVAGKGASTKPLIETIAKALSKAEGGQVEVMNEEGLEKLNLDPDIIDQFRKELEKIAGDKGWTLEVVELPGEVPEIRGIVEDDNEEGEGEGEAESEGGDGNGDGDEGQGSEEKFFKEEL